MKPLEVMRQAEAALQDRLNRLGAIIQDHAIQIVHSNTFTILEGALAARLQGAKHLWQLSEMDEGHPVLLPFLPAPARNCILGDLSHAVVALSHFLANFFAPHVAPDRLHMIYDGVESEYGHLGLDDPRRQELRQECRLELGLEDRHQVVCTVGRNHPEKGWIDLVATAGLLAPTRPDLRFVVVGENHPRLISRIQAEVDRWNLHDKIFFTGARTDAQRIMLASDVVFQPSRLESLSLVTLEAMAMSLPVVVTRCGGPEEVVRHQKTGLLSPVGNCPEMAGALAELLDDAGLRRSYGEAGRQVYLKNFTPQPYAAKYMELYRRLLRKDEDGGLFPRDKVMVLASLYAAHLASVTQTFHFREQLNETRRQLGEVLGSRSYRWLEPLRWLKRQLLLRKR
jgi:glycosyltransferase involved in cell wall biosynthesis